MLLGKFTEKLSGKYSFRESKRKDLTDDNFEILQFERDEPTEFGETGMLQLWKGGGKDFDWDNYDSDNDWGIHVYFFGFQNFLGFYTAPSATIGRRKFVLYVPRNDWSMFQDVIVEEFEYEGDQAQDEVEDFEQLLVDFIGEKYQLKKVSKDSLSKYIDE